MAILQLMDSGELDVINAALESVQSGLVMETFVTPLDVGRPDKPTCVSKRNTDGLIEYFARVGVTSENIDSIIALFGSLDTAVYDHALWQNKFNHMPMQTFIEGAPIGSWSFVLEGSSTPGETFLTQATKMALPSDLTPAILPANLHLVSMTWVNENDNADCDLVVYLNNVEIYTWSLTDCRWGVLNAQDVMNPLLALPERGQIKASITSTGTTSAKDGILTMYFRMVGDAEAGEWIYSSL